MLLLRVTVGCLLLGVMPAAVAQTPSAPPPAKPDDIIVKGQIPDADKKVCKTSTETGSILPKRVCRPKWQWEEMRARSIANLERLKADQQQRRNTRDALENRE